MNYLRKIFILLFTIVIVNQTNLFAQEFSCQKLVDDVTRFNETKMSNNKKWATLLLKEFPLSSDGNISFKYNIEASDTIDIKRAMEVTHNWIKQVSKYPEETIKDIDTIKHVFTCVFNYGDAAEYYSMAAATFIQALIDVKVEISEKEVVIKSRARQYELRGVNYYTGSKNEFVGIDAAYPVNEKKDHKESYAMAFINTNSRIIGVCKEYFLWLQSHYIEEKDKEDW